MTFDPHVPFDLPPLPPQSLLIDHLNFAKILPQHNLALQAISQLEGALQDLNRPEMFLSNIYLQESISSNAVENIHTTIESVFQDQTKPNAEQTEVNKEVLHYGAALKAGQLSMKKYGLGVRTIKAIHKQLSIKKGVPGEFRSGQNVIGSVRSDGSLLEKVYTPPPPQDVESHLTKLERFAAYDDRVFPLIKIALCHYQFEAIHPFDDGNGRTGRILMLLQLVDLGLLNYPALFLSGYLNENSTLYKTLLLKVSKEESWWQFLEFMLNGFSTQALKAHLGILKLKKAKRELRTQLFNQTDGPIRAKYIPIVIDHIFTHPITHAQFMEKETKIHHQTCSKYLKALVKMSVLKDQPSGKYRFFRNPAVFKALVVKTKK